MEGRYYRKDRKKISLTKHLMKRSVILGAVIGLPVGLYVLFGSHGVVQRVRLEAARADLQQQITLIEQENEKLRAEAKALEADLLMIEKVARERYGMSRAGETVYRVTTK